MPKGGRKGGAQFPQLNLSKAEEYAKKLVSKTHVGPQDSSVIFPGVFGTSGPEGGVRASALKQYGLLEGEKAAYSATQLAKDLVAAPGAEKALLRQRAFLSARIFKTLFDTFNGDTVLVSKIGQQASKLQVHPDNQERAATIFVESASHAGLATRDGDNVTFKTNHALQSEPPAVLENTQINEIAEPEEVDQGSDDTPRDPKADDGDVGQRNTARAVINVNVTLDSSLDTDKLERQLKLLRRYGAL